MSCQSKKTDLLIPVQLNKYTHIYKPAGDTFPGPSTRELEAGKYYGTWVPNDHTFIKGKDGKWNIFGITHPITSTENVHEGEFLSLHAKQNKGSIIDEGSFEDLPKLLAPQERPNESPMFFAPYVVQKDELYYMLYSPNPIRLAVSNDLNNWEPKGKLFREEEGARDPSVFEYNNRYYIIYCTERKVGMRTSEDLINWSEPRIIFESKIFDPESPSMIVKDGSFYLFVCSWDGVWDKKEVQGAYQHKTYVYHSDVVDDFLNRNPVTTLNAHAPEIFEEDGQWYISSVEWPNRGISLDKLNWK